MSLHRYSLSNLISREQGVLGLIENSFLSCRFQQRDFEGMIHVASGRENLKENQESSGIAGLKKF